MQALLSSVAGEDEEGLPFSLDVVQLHGLSQNASRCCLAVVGECDSKTLTRIFNPVECATVAGSVAFNKGTLAAFAPVAFGWAGPPAAGSVWPSGIGGGGGSDIAPKPFGTAAAEEPGGDGGSA